MGKTYKFCCHDCTTMARQPTYLTSPSIASKHDAPRASLHSRALTVPKLKVLLQNHDHHSPIFVNSHIYNTHPHTTTCTYTIRVNLSTAKEARTNIMVPGNRTQLLILAIHQVVYRSWNCLIKTQVCGLCPPHS